MRLQDYEKRLRSIIEQSCVGIVLIDEQGTIIEWNRGEEEITGLKRDEVLDKTLWDVQFRLIAKIKDNFTMHEQIKGIVLNILKTGQLGPLDKIQETVIQRPDGTRRVIQASIFPIKTDNGFMASVISCDITRQKAAEETQRTQVKKLKMLNKVIMSANESDDLQSLLENILILTLELMNFDCGGIYKVNEKNRVAELQYSHGLHNQFIEEIKNVTIDESPYNITFIKGKPIFTNHYERFKPDRAKKWEFKSVASIPFVSKDKVLGSMNIISKKRYFITSEEKEILIAIGQKVGLSIANMQIEKVLRESEEKYRVLFETAKDAIFLSDETGSFVDVNQAACKSLGYSKEELLKLSIREIDAEPIGYEAFRKVRDNLEEKGNFEVNQQRKDGTLLPVEITGDFFNIANKRISLAIARDITERKQAEALIRTSIKEKEVLLLEIHHRIKNNLQVVSSLLNMQARNSKDKDTINILSESRNRINAMALIHFQLYENKDLSRIDMKRFLDKLLTQLLQSYPVHDKNITWIVSVVDYPFPISIATSVGLIINELLSNILKHAFNERKQGNVEIVFTESDNGKINMIISDDGIGLQSRFDINTTGTFGLHLVKILVENQLEGKLEIIKEQGTTFMIEFEIADNCSAGLI
ncbi:MAG: PAS domain S-box protein [Methanosarcinales archaeon]|nr:PAS domain S-box protein [Methanosarcinales archaeon]